MTRDQATQAIKDETALYMETWVVPLINAIERGDTNFMKTFSREME